MVARPLHTKDTYCTRRDAALYRDPHGRIRMNLEPPARNATNATKLTVAVPSHPCFGDLYSFDTHRRYSIMQVSIYFRAAIQWCAVEAHLTSQSPPSSPLTTTNHQIQYLLLVRTSPHYWTGREMKKPLAMISPVQWNPGV